MLDEFYDVEDKAPKKNTLYVYSKVMIDLELETIAGEDLLWAGGSILFVLFYMAFHLKSFFLSSMSMLSILASFPLTFFFFGILF